MINRRIVAALSIALAGVVGFALVPTASAHAPDSCANVRSQVAAMETVWTAAEEQGGLTSAQRAWIANGRGVNARALAHCPVATPVPSPSITPTPAPSPSTSPTTSPPTAGWPNAASTGVPAGWSPTSTRTADLTVSTAGTVVEDIRLINADIVVRAANVTIRRVELQGGRIYNDAGPCANGLTVEDVSLIRSPGQVTRATDPSALGVGGYTARRVEINGLPEGFRVGGRSAGCGPVIIEHSYARVVRPDECGDWHGDGIQGYDGPALTVRRVTLDLIETGCGGTAPFFYPSGQGNTSVAIDGLLVKGGGYAFRLGTPGTVADLNIVQGSWGYGPIAVACGSLTGWQARRVTIDAAYQVTGVAGAQACDTSDGS
jgi:hypothetical protein